MLVVKRGVVGTGFRFLNGPCVDLFFWGGGLAVKFGKGC